MFLCKYYLIFANKKPAKLHTVALMSAVRERGRDGNHWPNAWTPVATLHSGGIESKAQVQLTQMFDSQGSAQGLRRVEDFSTCAKNQTSNDGPKS